MLWQPRPALASDIPALEALIPLSVRGLQAPYYSAAQMDAALGPVFGVDRQLITDGTYYVIEDATGALIGCGGWSKRKSLFGGDQGRAGEDPLLDPAKEPARVRAFFVHPAWARRGLGRAILSASEAGIRAAGFQVAELVATLAGEPLYTRCGYQVIERFDIRLSNGLPLPAIRMRKELSA